MFVWFQDVAGSWRNVVPSTVRSIESKGNVGNFLAVANRGRDDDRGITRTLEKWDILMKLKGRLHYVTKPCDIKRKTV